MLFPHHPSSLDTHSHSHPTDPDTPPKPRLYPVIDEYDSANMSENPCLQPSEEPFVEAPSSNLAPLPPVQQLPQRTQQTPVNSRPGRIHHSSHVQPPGKNMRGIAANKLFRQASVDVSSLRSSTILMDRPKSRGGSESSRFVPSMLGVLRIGKSSHPNDTPSVTAFSASLATSDKQPSQDWQEHTASADDDGPRLTRRHASDMSFGIKARKHDMLPSELLDQDGTDDHAVHVDETDRLIDRTSPKTWKKRFGRSSLQREESKVVSWNLLRRRKKSNLQDLLPTPLPTLDNDSFHRAAAQKNLLRDREFRFESELDPDTVFSLLNRICPQCGFSVAVRRGSHKLKVQVPSDGKGAPLLISVMLSRMSSGKNTLISVTRSRDDLSGRPANDIDLAGTLLKKRLDGHVEFIEDSFQSLPLDEAGMRMVESSRTVRI